MPEQNGSKKRNTTDQQQAATLLPIAAKTRKLGRSLLNQQLNVGVSYRQHCIDKWPGSKQCVAAEAVATTWQELADYWLS